MKIFVSLTDSPVGLANLVGEELFACPTPRDLWPQFRLNFN